MSKRPVVGDYDPFFQRYIDHVKSLDLHDALQSTHKITQQFIKTIPEDQGSFRYAEGKWSIREVIGHIMDAERILAYRALRFSRQDYTVLPGYNENSYAHNANTEKYSVVELANQLQNIRTCTIDLFSGFKESMLDEKGPANGSMISVLALGYIIAGHEAHHVGVIRERYL